MAPKILDLAPKEMKRVTTLNEFKAKIKVWPCRLSRTYFHYVMSFNTEQCLSIKSEGYYQRQCKCFCDMY